MPSLQLHGLHRSHAIDLGVDTTGGGARDAAKLRERAPTNVDRSDRGKTVVQTLRQAEADAKQIKKAAGLSRQGMDKSQVYGVSAVGADPETTSIAESNLATASGALHNCASRTVAIEWIYGRRHSKTSVPT